MTYNNAVKRIQNLPKLSNGSEHIKTVCSSLGSPQNNIKAIRICGDAGKTSCAQMLSSILSSGGYKVGYYRTGAFEDMRECIKIGEKEIPHAEFADIAKKIFDIAEITGCAENISRNDVMLIIALVYFSSLECDAVIFEHKWGDISHLAEAPILSVITSIFDLPSLSRFDELIPRGTKETVSCIQHKGIYEEISKACADNGCRLSLPLYAELEVKRITLFSTRFVYRGNEYSLGAFSPCQLLNAITVIEAAHALNRLGMDISHSDISSGISSAHLPLMCQVLAIEPTIIVATVSTERHLETLLASLAQVNELLHEKLEVFVSPDAASLSADLPSRLGSCSIACGTPKILDLPSSSSFKAQITDIISPIMKGEDTSYAALFIGDGKYIPELALQIKKNLGNII